MRDRGTYRESIPSRRSRHHMLDRAFVSLILEGYRMRVYVPYGTDWYGYSIRRLKENPSFAWQNIEAMFHES